MLITTPALQEFSSSAHKNPARSHERFHIKYSRQITPRATQEEGGEKKPSKLFSCFNKEAKKVKKEKGRREGGERLRVPPGAALPALNASPARVLKWVLLLLSQLGAQVGSPEPGAKPSAGRAARGCSSSSSSAALMKQRGMGARYSCPGALGSPLEMGWFALGLHRGSSAAPAAAEGRFWVEKGWM